MGDAGFPEVQMIAIGHAHFTESIVYEPAVNAAGSVDQAAVCNRTGGDLRRRLGEMHLTAVGERSRADESASVDLHKCVAGDGQGIRAAGDAPSGADCDVASDGAKG